MYFDGSGAQITTGSASTVAMQVSYSQTNVIAQPTNANAIECFQGQIFDAVAKACVTMAACRTANRWIYNALCIATCPAGYTGPFDDGCGDTLYCEPH